MLNNYFMVRCFVKQLGKAINQSVFVQAYSINDGQLVLEFQKNQALYHLELHFTDQFALYTFTPFEANHPRQSQKPFREIEQPLAVQNCVMHLQDRSFQIDLAHGFSLLIKLYGRAGNCILFQNNAYVRSFRKATKNDWASELSAYKADDFGVLHSQIKSQNELSSQTLGQLIYPLNHLNFKHYFKENEFDACHLDEQKVILLNLMDYLERPTFYLYQTDNSLTVSVFEPPDSHQLIVESDHIFEITRAFTRQYLSKYHLSQTHLAISKTHQADLEKLNLRLKSITKTLQFIEQNTSPKQIGDILMANLEQIGERTKKIELFDFYSQKNITIDLKTSFSAAENAQYYYKKAKKQHLETQVLQQELGELNNKKNKLEQKIDLLGQTNQLKTLKTEQKNIDKADKDKHFEFRRFEVEEFEIWVGKTAQNNDELLRQIHKNDIWLHARGFAGSHVAIRLAGKTPTKTVIEAAAAIAAHYSKGKTSSLCPVIYTPAKFVRKRKGSVAGQVMVEKETVILVEPKLPYDQN